MNNEVQFELIQKFLARKQKVIRWLDEGIVIRTEWDNLLAEADQLGMEASRKQLLRYYQHYHIGDLGR